MNPQITIANWALGRIYSEQLPQIALEWLEAGFDSPTLRILAGETNPIMSDVGPMFDRVLEELGFAVSTPRETVAFMVCEAAQQIVDDKVSPYDGALEIGRLWLDFDEEGLDFSNDIYYLAIEYENYLEIPNLIVSEKQRRQQVRAELEVAMMHEARKLITQGAIE